MTLLSRPYLVYPLALLCISSTSSASEEAFQSIQLAVTQQSQDFDFSDSTTSLNVWGMSGQYQYGQGPWNFILGYQQGDAADGGSNTERRYSLDFERQGYSAFVEYYFESIWLALGYAQSEDKTTYSYISQDRNNNSEEPTNSDFKDNNQVNYDSFTLESGYSYYTESGQFNIALGLTKQEVDENLRNTEFERINGELKAEPPTSYNINESGILSSLSLGYGHLINISETLRLSLNLGLRREVTLSGEGRIQETSRFQGASNNSPETSSDLQAISQTASTSQQGRISLQHPRASLSLSVDKLSDQSFSNAYFSAGVSWNF
ncbi:MAG: hypothetical protein V7785_13545 [Bermanella sp.]